MERPQRERLPGLESYGDRRGIFTVTSHPEGPAPANIKAQWLGIAFEVGQEDIVVIEPGTFRDGRQRPYTAIRVTYADAIEKLEATQRQEAARFWRDQATLDRRHPTDHLYFNGECGRLIVPEENTEILLGTNEYGWERFEKVPIPQSSEV